MIHESDSISSNKQKGAPKSCTKWDTFIVRRGRDKEKVAYLIFLSGMERGLSSRSLTTADQEILD